MVHEYCFRVSAAEATGEMAELTETKQVDFVAAVKSFEADDDTDQPCHQHKKPKTVPDTPNINEITKSL